MRGEVRGQRRDRGLELGERHGLVDQLDVRRLAAGQRPAGQRVLLGPRQAEPVDPHARQVRAPHAAVRRADTASSLATTRSAQSAKSLPPPTHQPWTWAITGFGQRQTLMSFCVGASSGAVAATKSLPGSQRAVGLERLAPVLEAAAEVVAGAERAAGAAHDDHLDRRRRGSRAPTASSHLVGHRRHDRVERLGPVERDGRHRAGDGVEHGLVARHAEALSGRRVAYCLRACPRTS